MIEDFHKINETIRIHLKDSNRLIKNSQYRKCVQLLDRHFMNNLGQILPEIIFRILRRISYCMVKILEDYLIREEQEAKRVVYLINKKINVFIKLWRELIIACAEKKQKSPKYIQRQTYNLLLLIEKFIYLKAIEMRMVRQQTQTVTPFIYRYGLIISQMELQRESFAYDSSLVQMDIFNIKLYIELNNYNSALSLSHQTIHKVHEKILYLYKLNSLSNEREQRSQHPLLQLTKYLVLVFFLQSICYRVKDKINEELQSLRIASWFCVNCLYNQCEEFTDLIRQTLMQNEKKYRHMIKEMTEIRRIILMLYKEENEQDTLISNTQKELNFYDDFNQEFYIKFDDESLNRQNYIYVKEDTGPILKEQRVLLGISALPEPNKGSPMSKSPNKSIRKATRIRTEFSQYIPEYNQTQVPTLSAITNTTTPAFGNPESPVRKPTKVFLEDELIQDNLKTSGKLHTYNPYLLKKGYKKNKHNLDYFLANNVSQRLDSSSEGCFSYDSVKNQTQKHLKSEKILQQNFNFNKHLLMFKQRFQRTVKIRTQRDRILTSPNSPSLSYRVQKYQQMEQDNQYFTEQTKAINKLEKLKQVKEEKQKQIITDKMFEQIGTQQLQDKDSSNGDSPYKRQRSILVSKMSKIIQEKTLKSLSQNHQIGTESRQLEQRHNIMSSRSPNKRFQETITYKKAYQDTQDSIKQMTDQYEKMIYGIALQQQKGLNPNRNVTEQDRITQEQTQSILEQIRINIGKNNQDLAVSANVGSRPIDKRKSYNLVELALSKLITKNRK